MPSIVGRALFIDKLVMNPRVMLCTHYNKLYKIEGRKSRDPHTSHGPFKMSASNRPVVAGDHSTQGDELILQISLNIFWFLNEN